MISGVPPLKNNQPVTQNEVAFPPNVYLVSKTDLKGQITDCNDAFVQISGFTREELLGKSHNIVRHPDMPMAAFKDLWRTVQAGLPWRGLVKNRCKNGTVSRTKCNTLLRCRHGLTLPPTLRRRTRLHHADDPPGA